MLPPSLESFGLTILFLTLRYYFLYQWAVLVIVALFLTFSRDL
jgi:hypothetical protein